MTTTTTTPPTSKSPIVNPYSKTTKTININGEARSSMAEVNEKSKVASTSLKTTPKRTKPIQNTKSMSTSKKNLKVNSKKSPPPTATEAMLSAMLDDVDSKKKKKKRKKVSPKSSGVASGAGNQQPGKQQQQQQKPLSPTVKTQSIWGDVIGKASSSSSIAMNHSRPTSSSYSQRKQQQNKVSLANRTIDDIISLPSKKVCGAQKVPQSTLIPQSQTKRNAMSTVFALPGTNKKSFSVQSISSNKSTKRNIFKKGKKENEGKETGLSVQNDDECLQQRKRPQTLHKRTGSFSHPSSMRDKSRFPKDSKKYIEKSPLNTSTTTSTMTKERTSNSNSVDVVCTLNPAIKEKDGNENLPENKELSPFVPTTTLGLLHRKNTSSSHRRTKLNQSRSLYRRPTSNIDRTNTHQHEGKQKSAEEKFDEDGGSKSDNGGNDMANEVVTLDVVIPPPPSTSMTSSHLDVAYNVNHPVSSKHSHYNDVISSHKTNPNISFDWESSYSKNDNAFGTTDSSLSLPTASNAQPTKKKNNNNDNFVRLNLRNSAGSCRGAKKRSTTNNRKKRSYEYNALNDNDEMDSRQKRSRFSNENDNDDYHPSENSHFKQKQRQTSNKNKKPAQFGSVSSAGVDPLDDYMDGIFHSSAKQSNNEGMKSKKEDTSSIPNDISNTMAKEEAAPKCARHQRPCRLLTVKKNSSGNKGRKFYVCSLPQGERCNHFQWEDDTIEATQRAILHSKSSTGFVARQVAAYNDRFRALTVPELRDEAKRRGLSATGKKSQLLARLSIWVRDEIAVSVVNVDEDSKIEEFCPQKDRDRQCSPCVKDHNDSPDHSTEMKESGAGVDKLEAPSDKCDADNDWSELLDESDECDSSDSETSDSSCDELELCSAPGSLVVLDQSDIINANDNQSMTVTKRTTRTSRSDCPSATPLHQSLRNLFGHSSFREGQEWAIRRCLSHQRTLLVAPTGLGKSLCYSLPATIMDGICIVVSPLISLMQDQLRQLPPRIPAATLSGSISTKAMAMIIDDILQKRIKILFVSPERLASAAFRRLIRPVYDHETKSYNKRFPTVSLLCVDEAHCLSQWGHNFRPSYLRLRSLIPHLEPKSILALTATAGPRVVRDICDTLDIPLLDEQKNVSELSSSLVNEETNRINEVSDNNLLITGDQALDCSTKEQTLSNNGVKSLECNRDNIDVFSIILENEEERLAMLRKILLSDKSHKIQSKWHHDIQSSQKSRNGMNIQHGCLSSGSVIVYVWRKKDAEVVAEQLNGAGVAGGVVIYHGGMDANARSKAQGKFMRGKARVCVATVAFGLGINKPDIVGVIHLCLPPSPEHYLQEIGRAGRDGRPAKAISLVLSDEFKTRHSLAHSNVVTKTQLNVLLLILKKLAKDALDDISTAAATETSIMRKSISGLDIALPIESTVQAIDYKEESIETILSLLEGNTISEHSLLSVEGHLPDKAVITLKKRDLEKLSATEPIAQCIKKCGVRLDSDGASSAANGTSNPYKQHLDKNGGTAMQRGFLAYSFGIYQLSVVQCARFLGPQAQPRHVYAALRRLQTNGELELALDMASTGRAIHLRLNQKGLDEFCPCCESQLNGTAAPEDLSLDPKLRDISLKLKRHNVDQEVNSTLKVEKMYQIIDCVATVKDDVSNKEAKSQRLIVFQRLVKDYFMKDDKKVGKCTDNKQNKTHDIIKDLSNTDSCAMARLSADLDILINDPMLSKPRQEPISVRLDTADSADYIALFVAKILHGIDAPRAPILEWFRHPLWCKWRGNSFRSLVAAIKTMLGCQ